MMILGSKHRQKFAGPLFPEGAPIKVDNVWSELGGISMAEKKAAVKIDTTVLQGQIDRLRKIIPSLAIYDITLEDLELLVKIIKLNHEEE
ncbi:hypothetical protein [Limosilactobacillus oris]|uniref:hypothetical protein n=1 Tax=Limosilactobacillus oris TaxID=1632 RepID=UPI002235DC15|nr:hypothetical protein [Limosilactobacillus oris]MCW4387839.1 hypothetical protein [Limosilactobacillus oris]